MHILTRDDYDALEIADNARRHLNSRLATAGDNAARALDNARRHLNSRLATAGDNAARALDNARRHLNSRLATAGDNAARALVSYAEAVIGVDLAKDLLTLLTAYPDRTLEECLNSMGYAVGQSTPEPTGRKCHVVVRNADDCDCVEVVRVFADSDAAAEFSGNTGAGRDTYVLDIDFEPAPSTDAELLATMLAASERVDLDIDGPDLDILAYDIADTMDKGEYGLGEITSDDIGAVLPAFLAACLAHADANTVTES